MGFYDTPDQDYNAEAARQEAQRQSEMQARNQADRDLNRAMYDNNGNGGGDWHIDAICNAIGFSESDANIIKCEYDRVLQGLFGGNPTENSPVQYQAPRSTVRQGDPSGATGFMFSVIRDAYFLMGNAPVLNSLRLWAFVDSVVLRNTTNEIVISYLNAVRKGIAVYTVH